MKTAILSLAAVLVSTPALAQANPGEQRISSPPPGPLNTTATNSIGQLQAQNSLTTTNQAGPSSGLGELGPQLTSLKAAVEQTLPTLTAFNARFANAHPASSRGQQWANAISGALSGALGRNSNSTSSGTSLTNFSQALNGLLNTNSVAPGSANLDPAILSQLRTLEADLTPVLNNLRNLNIAPSTNNLPNAQGSSPAFSRGAAAPGATPAPTGR